MTTFELKQTPLFESQFKKLHRNEQEIIKGMIESLRENPRTEDHLKGILACCNSIEIPRLQGAYRVVFRCVDSQRLVRLIALGPHKTVYADAERYARVTKAV